MDVWDGLVVLGIGSLGTGLWMFEPWLSLSVIGIIVTGIGLIGARLAEMRAQAEESKKSN